MNKAPLHLPPKVVLAPVVLQPSDVQQIVDLFQRCKTIDDRDYVPSIQDIQRRFEHTPPRMIRYWYGWKNQNGHLIAASFSCFIRDVDHPQFFIGLLVHPDYRTGDLGDEIIAWFERTIRKDFSQQYSQLRVFTNSRAENPYYAPLYQAHKYQPVRCFRRMEQALAMPIPDPQLPEGFQYAHAAEWLATDWVDLYNQTFVDHWNFHPMELGDRQYALNYPTYQPDLDWVVVAPDGHLAGFFTAHIDHEQNDLTGHKHGWINLLGTRRGYRRLGLARAMLKKGLQQLQNQGMDTALLGVDADNQNQAQTLYESVGFYTTRQNISYEKQLSLV